MFGGLTGVIHADGLLLRLAKTAATRGLVGVCTDAVGGGLHRA